MQNIKKLFSVFLVLFSLLCPQLVFAEKEMLTSPPSSLPVKINTSFYLWDLYEINEKNGTFEADIYLSLKWEDPRLAFQDKKEPMVFVGQGAQDQLQTIWWPELDFVSSQQISTKNVSLSIYPDGSVFYAAKVSGNFFAAMDFRKFPFDKQTFTIHIESFIWEDKTVEFVADNQSSGFLKNPHYEGLQLVDLHAKIETKEYPYMEGKYSDFVVSIHLERSSGFFLYQILIPLLIVLILTCFMFYLDVSALDSRLLIGQGSILVLVAMKFMINQDLPQIDYLTFIDYVFFFAYFSSALSILLSVIDYILWKKKNPLSEKLNRKAIWIPLVLFFVFYFVLLVFAKGP